MASGTGVRELAVDLVRPVAKRYAGHKVQRLLGFWVLWHSHGNMSALVASGILSRSGAYTQRAEFLRVFGVNVEDWHPELGVQLRETKGSSSKRRVTAGGNDGGG